MHRSDTAAARRPDRPLATPRPRLLFGSPREPEKSGVVTRRVEVLQIQRVIPCLVVVRQPEVTFAAFEFNRKDGWTRNQDCVDSAAEPRDVKFEVQRAGKPAQLRPQDVYLLLPCLALIDFEIVRVRRSQHAEDMVEIGSKEPLDGRGLVG